MILSYKCKLILTKKQEQIITELLHYTNFLCNVVAQEAFKNNTFKRFDIHKLLYHTTKNQYKCKSMQLANCINQVADSYKLQRSTTPIFKALICTFNNCNLNFNVDKQKIKFTANTNTTTTKIICNFILHPKVNKDSIIKNTYKITKDNNSFYLILFIETTPKKAVTQKKSIGVDLGIHNIAILSTGKVFNSKALNRKRSEIQKLRSKLQSLKTKSSKRKLKSLNRRVSNFVRNTNHIISKQIVSIAKALNSNLVLEDLKYIRVNKSTVLRAKVINKKFFSWSFFQLRSFIEYKASLEGVDLQVVKPHFTSQCCCKCGFTDKQNRKSQSCFSCMKCSFTLNADLNASLNLSKMFVKA